MLSILGNLIDRCIFTLMFICGVQLPAFIQHYFQRVYGHFNEAKLQLSHYQAVADIHFQGDLSLLVESFKQNSEQAVVHSASIIEQLIQRVDYLSEQITGLKQESYLEQIKFLVQQIDIEIAQQTLTEFTLNIPLTVEALSTGLIVAFLFLLIKGTFILTGQKCYQLTSKKTHNVNL
ncbi:DUF2937 family protein [Thalassotalea marina]|uniref:DUF2937 family protein n=1 Tax=Thalassotalea marina TaxID=1673741 RepID=A0A919BIV3_9GAMM|nr:DUF2937 family protein [Thalassotalea marina]GHF90821.1 hypothetical protein GCM10017161_18210 [Thalassotalea marina]